jgi:hypothetical protein
MLVHKKFPKIILAIFSLSSLASGASGSRQITATCRFQPSEKFFCVNDAAAT